MTEPGRPPRRQAGGVVGPAERPPVVPRRSADEDRPHTLAIDIGGTGLKASVLNNAGEMVADRVRAPTSYPMPPAGDGGLIPRLEALVAPLPAADRVSAGFPGMVRGGVVLSAPHFVTTHGPGSPVDAELQKAWTRFDLAAALESSLGRPARVANDADVQGLAVIKGDGLEVVITLGTGFGSAVFLHGALMPHLELAHQPFRKGDTYNDQLGERTRSDIGDGRWNRRVRKAVANLYQLFFYDHLYIGGGNASRVRLDALGDGAELVTLVDNSAGILGGIRLWDGHHQGL